MTILRRAALALPALLLAATVAACGSSASPSAADLTVTDPWAKAADSGMTAAFGTLVNDTDADITIVSASSDAATMELHEMAMNDSGQMVMRPKEGGIVVPAHGSHTLAPGNDHIMFMNLTSPLKPGDDVAVTLTAADGAHWTLTFPVRTFTGGNESYQPGATSSSMGTMSGSSTP